MTKTTKTPTEIEIQAIERKMRRVMTRIRKLYKPWHRAVEHHNALNDERRRLLTRAAR